REEARERRTTWVRRAGLAAVAGAAAAAVLVAGLAVTRDDAPVQQAGPPTEQVDVATYDDDVTADAALVNHTWGVEVKLTATGFDDGGRYQVAVVGSDGTRHPAGAFVGTGTREMVCNLNSAVLRPDASGFEVRDRGGDVVVSSTFA
ncbi:MAG: putative anti-sigma factor, partial [Nocardioides sp.]|nr:putative anti-sigma factor [Nocardioides sp.]